tara:strand:+ start:3160 stop:3582 length:423 start_codon:yes stop_codon:yes gene_type:complete
MKFLRGIEKFKTYHFEEKTLIGKYIINDGKYQEMLTQLQSYEKLLGIKDGKLVENNENSIKKLLLNYLDYLDYYIISHFFANVYDIEFNPRAYMYVEEEINIVVDFVRLLYNKKYPMDTKIDMVKYQEVRIEFERRFGRL